MVLLQRKLYLIKNPEGSNIFQGDPTFSRVGGGGGGGVQMLISIETHITFDFPGGSGPPIPPSGSAHVRSLKNIIGKLATVHAKISIFSLVCVAGQAGLSLIWSQTRTQVF